jgi:cytochrome b subunit of formate dehydrogenase
MSKQKTYPRFDLGQRIEHAVLLISFTTLAVTGLPQKFADASWAQIMVQLMGGIETIRIIHRVAAVVLMLGSIYHGGIVTYKVAVKRVHLTMLPGWGDVKDAFQQFFYNLGWKKSLPQMGRYTFAEKAEYWSLVWGTVMMIITGFMLWNPIATTKLLPGEFIPAAKAAHGAEAVLAVLAIVTWHVYHVHLKFFNKSMFTGRIDHHAMEEEHPLELARIESGRTEPPVDPAALRRRQRIFIPIAAVITLVLLAGLYIFVTFEETAIETVPRQNVEIFTPATPEP